MLLFVLSCVCRLLISFVVVLVLVFLLVLAVACCSSGDTSIAVRIQTTHLQSTTTTNQFRRSLDVFLVKK